MNPSTETDVLSRRDAVLRSAIGAAALAALVGGCASSVRTASLPEPHWPNAGLGAKPVAVAPPRAVPRTIPNPGGAPGGMIMRSDWARAQPIPSRMDRALPYYRITVHHDGMDTFTSTDRADAARRLESIRNAHLGRGFGDIGYHYIIDPAGRIWQGRPLEWQGAHVKETNQGNLGICMLGNYMNQRPTETQLFALDRFVISQMHQYRVPAGKVFTHREIGQSLCPGANLQSYMNETRRSGAIAHA